MHDSIHFLIYIYSIVLQEVSSQYELIGCFADMLSATIIHLWQIPIS
jgi:hypothetical protein